MEAMMVLFEGQANVFDGRRYITNSYIDPDHPPRIPAFLHLSRCECLQTMHPVYVPSGRMAQASIVSSVIGSGG